MQCYAVSIVDDMAKRKQNSIAKQGSYVDERLQRRQQQWSIEFRVLSLKVLVFETAAFLKYSKETTANFKFICKFGKV
jgi:hypothetical protein